MREESNKNNAATSAASANFSFDTCVSRERCHHIKTIRGQKKIKRVSVYAFKRIFHAQNTVWIFFFCVTFLNSKCSTTRRVTNRAPEEVIRRNRKQKLYRKVMEIFVFLILELDLNFCSKLHGPVNVNPR